MRKLLKSIGVIQKSNNKNGTSRINPYNPLSYIVLIVTFFVAMICFGIVGMWNEFDIRNPFKWN